MGRREKRQALTKLRQGRRDACEALVCQHYRAIYRFLAYLTGDAAVAEELTQETFASAWAAIGGFKGQASVGTWLHRIAYRKFIDSQRRRRRDADLMARLKEEAANAVQAPDPLHRLTDDEHSRLLYEAMRSLKPSEHTVIVLHYVQGFSFREMAQVLGEPVGTIKWQTSRALKKLRAYLTGRV